MYIATKHQVVMSLATQPMQPVLVRDPRTLVSGERKYAVLKGGSQMTNKQYSTTSISNTALQFSCPPPSGAIFVDRNVRLYVPVRLTFTGTPANGVKLLVSGFDAPRAFPLSSGIETLTASINNQSVSINLSDVIQPLMWYNTGTELKNSDYSITPCYQDQSQSYDSLIATNRNPLGDYSVSGDNVPSPRGAFPFVVVANPAGDGVNPVTAVVDIALCEDLYLSPFWWGKGVSTDAFFNVTTMDFNITFLSQAANRFWSHSSAAGGSAVAFATSSYTFGGLAGGPTSFGTTTGNSPQIFFSYVTPQETQVLSPNMTISYPYFDVQRYITGQAAVTAGSQATMISNNIQLNSIPRRMYIFVRKRNQDLLADARSTDTYFSIENLNIQWMNKNGLLASANKEQLYEMSVKNHCTMSWEQFSGSVPAIGNFANGSLGTVGSVICVEFGTDIGLDSLDAPGKLAQAMLQVQVTATNTSTATITPELYIITVLEGVFSIEGLGRASTRIGVISSQDILDAQSQPGINYKEVQEVNGGNFFSSIGDTLSKLWEGVKSKNLISKTLGKVPGWGILAPAVEAIGLGEGGASAGATAGGLTYPVAAHDVPAHYVSPHTVSEHKVQGYIQPGYHVPAHMAHRGSGVLMEQGGVTAGGAQLSRKELAKKLIK